MPSDHREALRIRPATTACQADALALVFADLAPPVRQDQVNMSLEAIAAEPNGGGGLLAAERDGCMVGALFAQLQPGRAAIVWPPRLLAGESSEAAVRLLEAACDWLHDRDVRFAQAILPIETFDDAVVLHAAGFRHIAHLLYLVATRDTFPTAPPAADLAYEPYDPSRPERFVGVLEATYEQSFDCPALEGMRTIDETLAGYRATGVFDPHRWLIVRHQGLDIGCLVLTDHPAHENWELVYMGVVPSARGRRWGVRIARHAQWLAQQAGRQRLVLAVDAANLPAIKTYSMAGFEVWERRSIYGKPLGTSSGPRADDRRA